MIELELPYPPTVNTYWRAWRGRMVISGEGRAYRERVVSILRELRVRPIDGALMVTIVVHPPDRRRRDIDNLLKAICDSLQHGGAFGDDNQIAHLTIRRADVVRGGKSLVRIMRATNMSNVGDAINLQAELLGAALRYCAVADWFEGKPCTWSSFMSVSEAMEVFNRVEAQLRDIGAQMMQHDRSRELLLEAAGVDKRAR